MGKTYLNHNPHDTHCRKDFQPRAGRSDVFLSSVVWEKITLLKTQAPTHLGPKCVIRAFEKMVNVDLVRGSK